MKIKKIVALLAVCLTTFTVNAQQQDGKTYLYYSDALNLASTQNLTIRAYEYEHRALDFDKKAMFGLWLPQFNLTGNYTFLSKDIGIDMNNLKGDVGGIVGGIVESVPGLGGILAPIVNDLMAKSWGMTLQESQFGVLGASMIAPIYMGGKIRAAHNAAKIKIEESDNNKQQDLEKLNTELSERYFGLSLAKQVAMVREEVVVGMQKHYNDAVALERSGIIANSEKLYAEMFLARSKSDEKKANRDIISVNVALSNTLNAKGDYMPLTNMFILESIESLDYFIQYAMDKSPLLKGVAMKKELANQLVKAKRAEVLPTISAIGAANIVDYQVTSHIPRAMIGVSINYTLFNGARNINELRSSKEVVKRVDVLEQKARLDISTLIEKSYNDILSLGEQVESYNATINFANEYLRVKEKAFNEGMVASSDVVDAQLNLAKSKIERIELAYQYDVALAGLLEICGLSHAFNNYAVGESSIAISY